MNTKLQKKKDIVLQVPIDASGIKDRSGLMDLKANFVNKKGVVATASVKLERNGTGIAEFRLDRPLAGQVIFGPANANDGEMEGLQTLTVDVGIRAWTDQSLLKLPPVIVSPWFWDRWLNWCQNYIIRGRLICPDGSPVPGAEVCAFDVDRFWWWCSKQKVGCAITDSNGNFTITFRWCCDWWPLWWWRRRSWQIDPKIFGLIDKRIPKLTDIPQRYMPDPVPNFAVLEQFINAEAGLVHPPKKIEDPSKLEALRPALLEALPTSSQLETLGIWPWVQWHPWTDCRPDIIFRATQDCGRGEMVILEEDCGVARWNISTTHDVTLVSTDEACCLRPPSLACLEEGCIILDRVCGSSVSDIGGNVDANPTPSGYLNPSPDSPDLRIASYDRPFGEVVNVDGDCTDWIDYYGFEYSSDGGVSWNGIPQDSTGSIERRYFDPSTSSFERVVFSFAQKGDDKWVIETPAHWAVAEGWLEKADEERPRWTSWQYSRLLIWKTSELIPDGVYHLRLRAYREVLGDLIDLDIPTLCGSQDENGVVVAIDNRLVGSGAGHPTSAEHPVPPGGVHIETTEPDTDFVSIRLGGSTIGPCGTSQPRGDLRYQSVSYRLLGA